MMQKPYPSTATHTTTIGALTHIDLWGKYDIKLPNKNQYYILFVDNYSRYVTVHFLKAKSDASKHVCDYLTYMNTRQHFPLAICINRGTEFINDALNTWTRERGIEIEMTAPYSLSQNGVTEHINYTLSKLAHAMLTAQNMPEFLWEYAIAHVAYLRNRSYSMAVPDSTPYERRYRERPNVKHLQEFGTPIWILTDGQHSTCKMLSKATEKIFISFEDGAHAITYYNKQMRKVLLFQNYQFHNTLPTDFGEIQIPNPVHEGEASDSNLESASDHTTQQMDTLQDSQLKKRPADDNSNVSPRKTRGVCLDFKRLDNPFLDEEDEDAAMIAIQIMITEESYAMAINDGPANLKEAKHSHDWLEWENTIQVELEQHRIISTWSLVTKPQDMIPIANKWVFI